MKKILTIFTIMLTFALLVGEMFYPHFPLVWLASDAGFYVFVRAVIVVVLAVILFSETIGISLSRPLLIGGAAILLLITGTLLVSDTLTPVDAVIFIETAIVLALQAIEGPASVAPELKGRRVGKFGVGNDFVKIG